MGSNKKYSIYTLIPYKEYFILYSSPRRAYLYYVDYRINLLTGLKEDFGVHDLNKRLSDQQLDHIVFHAFYEFGLTLDKYRQNFTGELGLYIEYDNSEKVQLDFENVNDAVIEWRPVEKNNYRTSFAKGKEHLLRGDCYQYNLTFPFKGTTKSSAYELMKKAWGQVGSRGVYGSFTYSSFLKKGYLSNSPECLFQYDQGTVETMPIKGTVKVSKSYEESRSLLDASEKNECELNMITDLLSHDLNLLSNYKANVVAKKSFLNVPGLVHSYSCVRAPLENNKSIMEILESLFPGGSITGAPKKRVMEIISDLENWNRGFYCGSTVIKSKKLYAASINIRSAVVDEVAGEVTYGAGGGITFDSTLDGEFSEMNAKKDSFSGLLKTTN